MNYQQDFLAFVTSRVALALAMTAALAAAAPEASAQNSFSVTISSSERFLMALGTSMETTVAQEEMCDNPNNRIQKRNRPAVRVENSADSDSNLTSFTLRIAEDDIFFGTGDTSFDGFNGSPIRIGAYNMPGMEILGATITDVSGQGSEDGTDKLLTVNFSGLAPGEFAIFNIDLDTTDASAFQLPDFREELFGVDTGNGVGTPAYFAAAFADGSNVPEAQFAASNAAAPYSGMNVRPYHAPDPILPFGGSSTVIPEPTSFMILGLGLFGLSHVRRRK